MILNDAVILSDTTPPKAVFRKKETVEPALKEIEGIPERRSAKLNDRATSFSHLSPIVVEEPALRKRRGPGPTWASVCKFL